MRRTVAVGTTLSAVAIIIWLQAMRVNEDSPAIASLALSVLAASLAMSLVPRRWVAAAAWWAIALIGWAAVLQLTNAPARVEYQHLDLFAEGPVSTVARGILVAQLAVLLVAGRGHVRAIRDWCRGHPAWALGIGLAGLVATAAAPSRDPRAYTMELLLASALQLLSLVTLVAAVRSVPADQWTRVAGTVTRVLGDRPTGPPRVDRWVITVAIAATAVSAILAYVAYDAHPHVPDEVIYLLHARYLADGMLAMPLPPVPAGFDLDLMQYEPTRWFSPVPPGWPMVLAVGVRLGIPWLVNPLLAGVAVVLTWLVAARLMDHRHARLTTLLLACSPWFLFMAMSLMTHTATLVFALAATLGVAVARERGTSWPALGAGMAVGAVSLIRPLEGLIAAVLLGFWSLGARGRRFRLAPSTALVIGTAAVGGLVAPYNARMTGSARTFPINQYIDTRYAPGSNDLGFGANRGLGWSGLDPFPGHGVADVVVNSALNASQVDVELLGWPVGAVPLLLVPLLLAGRPARMEWYMVATIGAVVGAHAFYWYSGGPDFGARYWFLIIVPCCILAARGLATLDGNRDGVTNRPAAIGIGLALALTALLVFVPWRAMGKYHHYRGMRPDIRELARASDFGRSLVLVRGARFPDYMSAAAYNPIDLRADVPIYAWDATAAIRAALLNAYPDRTVWIVDGPSLTHASFRIAAGPLTPAEALTTPIPPDAAGGPPLRDPVTLQPLDPVR